MLAMAGLSRGRAALPPLRVEGGAFAAGGGNSSLRGRRGGEPERRFELGDLLAQRLHFLAAPRHLDLDAADLHGRLGPGARCRIARRIVLDVEDLLLVLPSASSEERSRSLAWASSTMLAVCCGSDFFFSSSSSSRSEMLPRRCCESKAQAPASSRKSPMAAATSSGVATAM